MRQNISLVEDVLLTDSHIVAIHQTRRLKIPAIDLLLWLKEQRETQEQRIRHCMEFLGLPLIEDDFTDGYKRKEWIYQMERRYANFDDFYNRNALRYTYLNGLSMCVQGFSVGYEGTNPKQLGELIIGAETFIPPVQIYDCMVTPMKIRLVRGFKSKILDLLKFLSRQIPLKERAD